MPGRHATAEALDTLLAHGRLAVSTEEAAQLLHVPPEHVRVRMQPLVRSGRVFSPARGLWVVIPPEYRTWRVIPGAQFIEPMMAHLGRDYYLGWLSAAEMYGAAHQRPQVVQVAVDRHLADRDIERARLRFIERRHLSELPRLRRNVPTGQVWVSAPEATALDLAAEPGHGGGVSNVATVLAELAEENQLQPRRLAEAAEHFSLAAVRRLGFLLDTIGQADLADVLHERAEQHRHFPADVLAPTSPVAGEVDARWRLRVNTDVEADL
jgi:predicted transcriptional regulator of viral defense system